MKTEVVGLKFALRLTRDEEARFVAFAGARRHIYNWGLERRMAHYRQTQTTLSFKEQCRELTLYKQRPENTWLGDVHSQVPQQALRDLNAAFQNFFAGRARFPRFQSAKRDPLRFRIPQSIRVEDDRLFVPKLGWVRFRKSREIEGIVKSARFKCSASGRWFVSLTVHRKVAEPTLAPVAWQTTAGADLGLTHLVTLSDGTRIVPSRSYRRAEHKLARLGREVSRKKPGSRNRAKAKLRLAREHERVGNHRHHHHHRLTHRLTCVYDTLGTETLSVRGLARTKLAKAIHDASWGELARQLEYKAKRRGKHLVRADRLFPSTRRCSVCHSLTGPSGPDELSIRAWYCPVCRTEHDRDENAAANLKFAAFLVAAGLAETQNACGETVRPWHLRAHLDEAGTRIPTPAAKAA